MTSTLLYTAYTVAHVYILHQAISIRSNSRWLVWVLFLITEAALVYDNGIIAIGHLVGEGNLLYGLNLVRFLTHALFTPTLILVGFNFLKRAEVSWSNNKLSQTAACLITTVLIGIGLTRFFATELAATTEFGVLRYRDTVDQGPPIAAIVTIILLIIWGVVLWRQTRWPWLCLAAVGMFISAAIPPSIVGPVVGSGGEVILAAGILATEMFVQKQMAKNINTNSQLQHA